MILSKRHSRIAATGLAAVLMASAASLAHDMWLESEAFFAEVNRDVRVRLGNGTIYDKSENAVDGERLTRFDVTGPDGAVEKIGPLRIEGNWLSGPIRPTSPGNYWIAAATKPRLISLGAEDFNEYLEHDGVLDVLEERKTKGILDRDEVEQYSKYVKTYLQVGDLQTENFAQPLGLAIELIPQTHPYRLKKGDELTVEAVFRGEPLSGLWLHAAAEGSEPISRLTDKKGRASFRIESTGRWYIRGIHLFEVSEENRSYESYWTSLTFAVR